MISRAEQNYAAQMERYMDTVSTATAEFQKSVDEAREHIREFAESDLGKEILESLTEEQRVAVLAEPENTRGQLDEPVQGDGAQDRTTSGRFRHPGIFD